METNYNDLKKKMYSDRMTIQEYRAWVNSSVGGVGVLPAKARWRK